jgi:hypothetical protein
MLRLLIGTGVLLMVVGFGAAGWQYWQGLPADTTAAEDADAVARASGAQLWLITPTGGIVPDEESRAFLVQDRLVPDRMARLTVTAGLDSLLVPGEKLPAGPYLEVLADIRAPSIGQMLCPILTARLARTCAVHLARVVPGSVDALRGEARFELELAYRQNVEGEVLPDLAAHVLRTETVRPDPAVLPLPASAEAAFAELVAAILASCEIEDRAATCRSLGLTLDWAPETARRAEARIGWLAPLPEGMTTLPPIEPLPEG